MTVRDRQFVAILQSRLALGEAVELELHGFEQQIYVVFERVGETLTPFKDDGDEVLKYPSLSAAKMAFSKAGLAAFEFVHTSAYVEMIGLPDDHRDTQLRQRLTVS